jgi:hypothetical protein
VRFEYAKIIGITSLYYYYYYYYHHHHQQQHDEDTKYHMHYCVSVFTSSENLNYVNTETEILSFWRTGKGYETIGNKILVVKKYNPTSWGHDLSYKLLQFIIKLS